MAEAGAPDRPADEALLATSLRGLGIPETVLSLLLAHAEAVGREGDRLGLVSRGDLGSVVRRHTVDSLLFAKVRAPGRGERWADAGSGAGFPGLVLAVCYPAASFTLLEPQRRRSAFLQMQVDGLGLSNVEVVEARAEDVPDRFRVGVARALKAPRQAMDLVRDVLAPDGVGIVAVSNEALVPPHAEMAQVTSPISQLSGYFLVFRAREAADELWTKG